MSHLAISLLGQFRADLDGLPLTNSSWKKARALLVYLVVEANRPHRREALAAMLWPDRTGARSRSNLRSTLYRLRKVIGDQEADPAHLSITPHEVQFNPHSDYWLDVNQFCSLLEEAQEHHPLGQQLCSSCQQKLHTAADLYRGDFLGGFTLPESPQFEWWLLVKQESYHRQVLETLAQLAYSYELDGDYARAGEYISRELELEPWHETAHRRLMRTLALNGQRSEALRHYETCNQILIKELGVEPSEQTVRLYERIQAGDLESLRERSKPRHKIFVPAPPAAKQFAGFEPELSRLTQHLESALEGQGQVVFITGGAGRGKTTMIGEFASRSMRTHKELLVSSGSCNAQSGIGDPYLPFRQILRLLTGDLDSNQIVGTVNEQRLSAAFPDILSALLEVGPDLVGSMLLGEALLHRTRNSKQISGTLRTRLETLLIRQGYTIPNQAAASPQANARSPGDSTSSAQPALERAALFDQVIQVLRVLARQHPLILALDDLHWADPGTANLLFHLGRNLAGSRILVVGAYRPEELTQDWVGSATSQTRSEKSISARHPLRSVVNELQTKFGDILIDLSRSDGRAFVEAYLDSEPNSLDQVFRQTLYQHTNGHALFTVELLRSMQERGDLVQYESRGWVANSKLDWDNLPPRVEAVIAERLDLLILESQTLLAAASVQGVTFSVEVLARTQKTSESEIVNLLSDRLSKQHRLVRALGFQRSGDHHQARYMFQHHLYQKYLYQGLDPVARVRQHQAVAQVLESIFRTQTVERSAMESNVVRLAWHFEQAGMLEKAIEYLIEAGTQAYLLSANLEAIAHYKHALELLDALPKSSKRNQRELNLQIALSAPLRSARGYGAPEFGKAIARACELAQEAEDIDRLIPALFLLGSFYNSQADYHKVLELEKEIKDLGEFADNPLYLNLVTPVVGVAHLLLGNFEQASENLSYSNETSDLHQREVLVSPMAQDMEITCLIFRTWNLWFLGYPDQALKCSQEALERARSLNHLNSLVFASGWASCVIHSLNRDYHPLRQEAEALLDFSLDKGFDLYQALAKIFLGKSQIDQGGVEESLANLCQGLTEYKATGHKFMTTLFLIFQAEAYGKIGQVEQGLNILAEARTFLQEKGERLLEAEIDRITGELLLYRDKQQDKEDVEVDIHQAELQFRRAIQVASRQGNKSLELRAVTSLCRLWGQQGRAAEACQTLEEIYSWFSEGFDTPDLQEARVLMDELEFLAPA